MNISITMLVWKDRGTQPLRYNNISLTRELQEHTKKTILSFVYFFIRNKLKYIYIYTSQSNSCKHLSHYLYFHRKWKITRFHSPTNLTTSRVGSGNFSQSSHGKYRELIKQAIGIILYKHQIFPSAVNEHNRTSKTRTEYWISAVVFIQNSQHFLSLKRLSLHH
jgi:hypothetical protein